MENGEEGGGGGGGIGDVSVGTIVWVRRRNGSWWPGRILGSDELAESHLLSPRSGTPVKLLGREDASVDWYNLEKSKRVKAFRCGEFNACIERAEAAQGIPIKKREKYARREDAILHALELEKKQTKSTGTVPAQHQDVPVAVVPKVYKSSVKTEVSHRYKSKKSVPNPNWENLLENNNKFSVPVSVPVTVPVLVQVQVPYQPGVSHAFDTGAALLHESVPVRKRSQCVYLLNQSDQDLSLINNHEQQKDFMNNHFLDKNDLNLINNNNNHENKEFAPAGASVKIESMDFLQEPMPLQEDDFELYGLIDNNNNNNECRNRNGPCDEIGPLIGPGDKTEDKDETETETESLKGGESSEETDTDIEGPNEVFRDTRQIINQVPIAQYPSTFKSSNNYITRDIDILSYNNNNNNNTDISSYNIIESQEDNTKVSQWNIKGKRNIRNPTTNKSTNKTTNKTTNTTDNHNHQLFYQPKEEVEEQQQQEQGDYSDEITVDRYYQNYENAPILIDVDLKVQASYQGERVPLVSLMSRLNGKAIIGHPVQIEILENGTTNGFFPCTSTGTGTDTSTGTGSLPPVWRTGRRTVKQRTPRFKKSSKNKKKGKKSKNKIKTKNISSIGGVIGTGFVKSDGVVPLVTCVPVKVVFSRILEAIKK